MEIATYVLEIYNIRTTIHMIVIHPYYNWKPHPMGVANMQLNIYLSEAMTIAINLVSPPNVKRDMEI